MRTIAIDLESYYDKDLSVSKWGSVNYLAHPEGDIYLLAAASDDGLRWTGRPEDFDWSLVKNARVIATMRLLTRQFSRSGPNCRDRGKSTVRRP